MNLMPERVSAPEIPAEYGLVIASTDISMVPARFRFDANGDGA
jgi:hypothetical protein